MFSVLFLCIDSLFSVYAAHLQLKHLKETSLKTHKKLVD